MDCMVPIANYQRTDASLLLKYAEKLFQDSTFHQYLTPQQLIVLNKVLTVQDPVYKEKVWVELVNSNVVLDVVKKLERDHGQKAVSDNSKKSSEIEEIASPDDKCDKKDEQCSDAPKQDHTTTQSSSEISHQSDVPVKKEADLSLDADFSEVDLENLQQQLSGTEFIGNLSLKIRYVLWESAIDPLCDRFSEDKQDLLPLNEAANQRVDDSQSGTDASGKSSVRTEFERNQEEREEDYDVESDENDNNVVPVLDQKESNQTDTQISFDDFGRLIFVLEITRDTLSALGVTNTQAIIENFNRIYHNFENDRENLLKRLKLEESDKLLEPSKKRSHQETETTTDKEREESMDLDVDSKKIKSQKSDTPSLSVNLGSANLSLKHLLASIQDNKSKLDISDYELRHLIMDVRKNRSKWASDDKIGQEELYDACEKVVLELRNFTEHSTAFLNKVSKREAPNYYQIIKKPMDLNTVLKKLKTYQYNSKQEFVDDVMLIWKNCLTYNSDPKHFLRTHAIAMQKKSLALIPLIPDITIRDRSEVERELEDIDKENDKDGEEEEEVSGTGRKGGNVRGIKHGPGEKKSTTPETPSAVDELRSEISNKGFKGSKALSADEDNMDENEDISQVATKSNTRAGKSAVMENGVSGFDSGADIENLQEEEQLDTRGDQEPIEKEEETREMDQEPGYEEDDEEDEEDGELGSNMYLVEKDDDKDDLELSTWKNSTASVRAELCIKRGNLFDKHGLNMKAPAILRNPGKMKDFEQFLKEYKDQQNAELERRKLEQESIMKNGFGTVVKQEEEDISLALAQQSQGINNDSEMEKGSTEIELDDANFLTEYNVANSVPAIKYKGIDNSEIDQAESKIVESILSNGNLHESEFLANKDKGLNPKINANIQLIQEIRHICHKIALIRMLQNPQNPSQQVKSNQINSNSQIWDTHKYKFTCIDDDLDLDPVSRLSTRNQKHDKQLIRRLMHKNVSKIAMSNGFESTQPVAINMLTEIAGEYLSNLVKTVKIHHESTSLNPKEPVEILEMSLLENGIKKPDDLYSYIEAEFVKKNNKLTDIKLKLNNFLKEILRPTLQDLSEKNFEDESQSFMTGDFSSEITGEDFFGFKDLGLDREFGVLSNSVPMQLLTFQFQGKGSETKIQDKKIQPEEFNDVAYSDVTANSVQEGKYWKTLQPLLERALSRFKNQSLKNGKQKTSESASGRHQESTDFVLAEDEDIPSKSKSSGKPRLPPTGKISTNYRKKPISDAFFAPDHPSQPIDIKKAPERANRGSSDQLWNEKEQTSSNETADITAPQSFTLSLPKVSE
ncbi:LANO_0E07140g1_1 [Lachancea nothofagi CBS 11611]|uniref:SAGA complex subunit Spt7 n=1 Tax=Lachancea nothofagi CBS 11611 TaxID=1266666 RepID=A0A1G4JUB9_9SACH|nr:LANO_0E07140g1_1 [Lachancea nothofagi CBS 11611]